MQVQLFHFECFVYKADFLSQLWYVSGVLAIVDLSLTCLAILEGSRRHNTST